MKNINQIKAINKTLEKEKDKFLHELSKVNLNIQRRINNIKKVMEYQNEYNHGDNFKLTKSIPALNKNLIKFSNNIQTMIHKEEYELNRLNDIKQKILYQIDKLNKKIQAMDLSIEELSKKKECD